MSSFLESPKRLEKEFETRKARAENVLTFGVNFLDDAMDGILQEDLVLVGAPTGVGKTQFCVNLALRNVQMGRRVHFIALEAYEGEIESRIKFSIISDLYRKELIKPALKSPFTFRSWMMGHVGRDLNFLEEKANEKIKKYINLKTLYKNGDFGIRDLVDSALSVQAETDLIIVDHIHFFDFDTDNENKEMKEIIKTVRQICLVLRKPIVLVSHLRKRDRKGSDLVAGVDEFHGSSDLVKIATKIISLGQGGPAQVEIKNGPITTINKSSNTFDTYFRIAKNRIDGSVTRYIGVCGYSYLTNEYNTQYTLARLKSLNSEIEKIPDNEIPYWAKVY